MKQDRHDSNGLPEVPTAVLLAWGVTPSTTKGPKPRWSLEQLLDTAVELGDQQGIDAISMSGVAKALGSGTMSLYRYVESREDLVILAADRALGSAGVEIDGAPENQLRTWVRKLRAVYEQHPWLTTIPVGTEPLLPSYLVWLEAGLKCLEPLGVTGTRAITVITMLWTYTRGDVEQTAHLATHAGAHPAEQMNKLIAARLRTLNRDRDISRVLSAIESDPYPQEDEDEFDAAINIIIKGLSEVSEDDTSSSAHE